MNDLRKVWRLVLAISLFVACVRLGIAADDASLELPAGVVEPPADHAELIAQLIKKLGSNEYVERVRAESQLLEMGTEVIDALQLAERDSDLEIASRASYILQRIRIGWIREDDPVEVKHAMERYGELSHEDRRKPIALLSALKDDVGLGALCRIVRYESSPILARAAALAILNEENAAERASQGVAVMAKELGSGERAPIEWLQAYMEQLGEPEVLNPSWLPLLDDELKRFVQISEETEQAIIEELLQHQLTLTSSFPDAAPIFEVLHRQIDLPLEEGASRAERLAEGMSWVLDEQKWPVLDLFETHYAGAIRNDRLLVYLSAAARARQGMEEEAEEFAKRAFELQKGNPVQRNGIADTIAELGCHNWAEREWQFVIENLPAMDGNSIIARRQLANWRLHDRGDDEAAAKLLTDFFAALDANPALKKTVMANRNSRTRMEEIQAERDYFLACHAESEGDFAKQRQYLEQAITLDDKNADVLIAMYHLKEADEAYHEKTVKLIRKARKYVENRIEQSPNIPHWYNHWAWLISNTEGDFSQAVEFSLHSLTLSPKSPSYLDTLGRCYYAAGDLDQAIRYQQQAVELHPQVMTMQRQLDFFQKELAKRETAAAE